MLTLLLPSPCTAGNRFVQHPANVSVFDVLVWDSTDEPSLLRLFTALNNRSELMLGHFAHRPESPARRRAQPDLQPLLGYSPSHPHPCADQPQFEADCFAL